MPVEAEPARKNRRGRDAGTVAVIILTVLAAAAAITYLGPILRPFLVALFLFYAVRGTADALLRMRWPPWLAYLSPFIAVAVAGTLITLFVYAQTNKFPEDWANKYQPKLFALLGQENGEAKRSFEELFRVSTRDVLTFVFHSSIGAVEGILLTFFYLLFFLLGSHKLAHRVRRAFPGERGDKVVEIGRQISTGIKQFIWVKTLVSLGLGASAAVMMWLFGLDYWLLWGFLFFALNYVTYFGSIAACIPPIALAYLGLDSLVAATALSILIVLNRLFWIDFVEIRFSGKQLNLDSVLLLVWLAYWGWVWGILGLILAFPMIVSLKIILESFQVTRAWAVLMSEE